MGGGIDGRMGGWMDGWMDGWVDGWMDGWMDGWIVYSRPRSNFGHDRDDKQNKARCSRNIDAPMLALGFLLSGFVLEECLAPSTCQWR